jgi:polyisoprenoid-binding protein YceI
MPQSLESSDMKILAASLAVALAAGGVWAAPARAQLVTDPARVKPGTYSVEPFHTRVLFSLNHMGLTTYYGEFTGASGSLTLDPTKASASALSVRIPVANVSTSNPILNGELKSADWFDAAKFPTISFVSTKVSPAGHGTAKVTGDLTLHGVTKPVVLTVKFNGATVNPIDKAYSIGFEVSGHIKRSAFGVAKYVPLVGDDVTLIISAAFEAK